MIFLMPYIFISHTHQKHNFLPVWLWIVHWLSGSPVLMFPQCEIHVEKLAYTAYTAYTYENVPPVCVLEEYSNACESKFLWI